MVDEVIDITDSLDKTNISKDKNKTLPDGILFEKIDDVNKVET